MTTRDEADRAANLLWERLLPNFPEMNGMAVGEDPPDSGDWYISATLEKIPLFEGKPIEMPTEFLGLPVDWTVIGKIRAQ